MSAQRRCGACAVAAALLACWASAVLGAERYDFITRYQQPVTAEYVVYYDELRRERFLESVADELNRVLELPATVTLETAECGHSTTSWAAESRTVTVCYEFLDAVLLIAAEHGVPPVRAEQMFSGAVTFALFDEIGRALVSLYALPVRQGALRAGEEFASITLAAAEQAGDPSAAAALEFFDVALTDPDAGLEFLEMHGFDRERFESVACVLYGNSPASHVPTRSLIPAERLARCPEEVLKVASEWDGYLKDHARGAPISAPPLARSPAPARL